MRVELFKLIERFNFRDYLRQIKRKIMFKSLCLDSLSPRNIGAIADTESSGHKVIFALC